MNNNKQRKLLLTTLAVIAVMFSCLAVAVDQSWIEVDADEEVVYAQDVVAASDDGGITVRINVGSGGAMPKYANLSDRPWHQFASTAQRVIMPLGLTTLDANAFKDFTQLKTINLTYKIKAVGNGAFDGCTSLESIIIPANTLTIGTGVFKGCSSLKNIEVESGSRNYISEDGVLMALGPKATYNGVSDIQTYTLLSYPAMHHGTAYSSSDDITSGIYVIPFGVTYIAEYAFYNVDGLKNIVISEAVETIGAHAFDGCTSLQTITFPDSVTSIGEYAFYDNTSLKAISFGTFKGLGSQTAPASGTKVVGDHAFDVSSGNISKLKFVLEAYNTASGVVFGDSFPSSAGQYIAALNGTALSSGRVTSVVDMSTVTESSAPVFIVPHSGSSPLVTYEYAPDTTGLDEDASSSLVAAEGVVVVTGSSNVYAEFYLSNHSSALITGSKIPNIKDLVFQDGVSSRNINYRGAWTSPDVELYVLPSSWKYLNGDEFRLSESVKVLYVPYTANFGASGFWGLTSMREYIVSGASESFMADNGSILTKAGNVIGIALNYDGIAILPNKNAQSTEAMRSSGGTGGAIVPDSYTNTGDWSVPAGSKFDSYAQFSTSYLQYFATPSSLTTQLKLNNNPSQQYMNIWIPYHNISHVLWNNNNHTEPWYDTNNVHFPAGMIITGKEYTGVLKNWSADGPSDQPYRHLVFSSVDGNVLTLATEDVAVPKDLALKKNAIYLNTEDVTMKYGPTGTEYECHYVLAPEYTAYYDDSSKLVYMVVDKCLVICGYADLMPDSVTTDTTVIPSYSRNGAPWASIIASGEVEHIIIAPGITTIGDYAFTAASNNIKSVYLNEEVTSIGKYAFSDLNMEYQWIPKAVTSLGEIGTGDAEYPTAFSGCENLKWIDVSVNNANYASDGGCLYRGHSGDTYTRLLMIPQKLTGTLTVAEGVTVIAPYAGMGSSITAIDFNAVVKLGTHAFANSALLTVETKEVETIADAAFQDSKSISTITFATDGDTAQTISIGENAFDGCTGLTMMQMNTANTTFGADAIPTMGKTDDKLWWEAGITKISNITTNGYDILKQAQQFFTVGEVPIEYEYFGYNLLWAFIQKTGTLRIIMNDATIGYGTMPYDWTQGQSKWNDNAGTITSVEINTGVRNIAPYAFYNLSTTDYVLPTTVKTIGNYAFMDSTVKTVKAQGVSEIGEGAFTKTSGTPELTSFIGSSVSSIGASAFEGCEGLTKFDLESVKSVGSDAFKGTKITSAVFGKVGSDADSIGSGAFNVDDLKTVVFTSDVTNGAINSSAFQTGWYMNGEGEGTDTISGTIPAQTYFIKEGIVLMGYIYDTRGEKSIEWSVQSGLLTIDGGGYGTTPQFSTIDRVTGQNSGTTTSGDYKLDVYIPEAFVFTDVSGTVTPATSTVQVTLTKGDTPMTPVSTTLTTEAAEVEIDDLNLSTGVRGAYTITVTCTHDSGSITAEAQFLAHSETVSAERPAAWNDISISILKDVPSIHDGFYSNLNEMTSAVLNSVSSIGKSAFEGCTALTSLTMPSQVSRIPDSAFAGCTNLAAVGFDNDNMTSIAYNAFSDCNSDGISISVNGVYKGSIDPAETPVMNGSVLRDLLTTQAQQSAVAKLIDDITLTSPVTPYTGATVDFNGHVLTNRNGNVFSRAPTYIVDSNESQRNNFTYNGSWFLTPEVGELPTYAYTLGGALLENGDLKDTNSSYKNIYYLLNLATVAVSDSTMTYDGMEKKPALASVSVNGYEIDPSLYSVIYGNNVHAGEDTAYAIVSLNKLPSLRGTGHFSIEPATLTLDFSKQSFATILDSEPQTFKYCGTSTFNAVAKGVLIGNLVGMRTYEDVPITITAGSPNVLSGGYSYGKVSGSGVYTVGVASTDYVAPETSSTKFFIDKVDLKLTVDPSSATKVYDGTDTGEAEEHKLVYEVADVSGLIGSDTVATKPKITSYSGAAGYYSYADSAAAGHFTMTTPIVINNPTSGVATSNYNLIWDGQMYIQPAHIVLYAEDKAKKVGGEDPELTAKALGLVNGETATVLNYTVERIAGEDIGKYTIFVYGAEEQGNYVVSFQNGTFTIANLIETVNLYEFVNNAYALKLTYKIADGIVLDMPEAVAGKVETGTPAVGYLFQGWKAQDSKPDTIDATSTDYYAPDTKYFDTIEDADETTNMYAVYRQAYTLTFNDGSTSVQTMADLIDGKIIVLPNCITTDGKQFIGWSTANPATEATLIGTFGQDYTFSASQLNLYAYVVDKNIVVTFQQRNSGSGDPAAITDIGTDGAVAYAKGYAGQLPLYAPAGYKMVGWYTWATGDFGTFVGMPGDVFVPTENMTLVAKVAAAKTITFSDGSASIATYVDDVVILPNHKVEAGKVFLGWAETSTPTTLIGTYGTRLAITESMASTLALVPVEAEGGSVAYSVETTFTNADGSAAYVGAAPFNVVVPSKIVANTHGLLTITKTADGYGKTFSLVAVPTVAGSGASATIVQIDEAHFMVCAVTGDITLQVRVSDYTGSYGHKTFAVTGFAGSYHEVNVMLEPKDSNGLAAGTVALAGTEYYFSEGQQVFAALSASPAAGGSVTVSEGQGVYEQKFVLDNAEHRVYYAYATYTVDGVTENSVGIFGPAAH